MNAVRKALDGKVALVTGSSRGIGAAIARRFIAEGTRVALHGRDAAALAEVQASIRKQGIATTCVSGDVTQFEEIERELLGARNDSHRTEHRTDS